MLTQEEWFNRAILFDLGICQIYGRPVYIESRDQSDGKRLWVLKMERSRGWVLGKDTEWYYEPLPSSRTDEFIALTRFESPAQAHLFWVENVKEKKDLYL